MHRSPRMISRLGAFAAIAAASALTLTGCFPLPPTAPAPPDETAPQQPTTSETPTGSQAPQQTDPPSEAPDESAPPADGDLSVETDGSTAVITADGTTWEIEMLEVRDIELSEVEMFGEPEAEVVPPPDGQVLVGACMTASLVENQGNSAWLGDILDVAIEGVDSHSSWDYDLLDGDENYYGSNASTGDTIPRTCPMLVLPEDAPRDSVTLIVTNAAYDSVEDVVSVP